MIKKIKIEQLKPGMFVHDFNCGWLQHPFMVNKLKIKNEQQIETIVNYRIREVYIDTDRGLDVPDAPTKQDVDQLIRFALEQLSAPDSRSGHSTPLAEEMQRAKALVAQAKVTTRLLMEDARLGKQIDMHAVENVVDTMTRSVLNNKDALISLLRVKNKDEYTFLHSLAVSALCISFGARLGFHDIRIRKSASVVRVIIDGAQAPAHRTI